MSVCGDCPARHHSVGDVDHLIHEISVHDVSSPAHIIEMNRRGQYERPNARRL